MPPQPRRRWHGARRSNATAKNSNGPQDSGAQSIQSPAIKRAPSPSADPIDIMAMYQTAAGGMGAKRFQELQGILDPSLLRGLANMGFEYMSPVQQKVLTELPSFKSDCIVQAKTGTGKTIAFLLPAIQRILKGDAPGRGQVGILVICPTRELALQIAKEADRITASLPRKMECHTAYGGTARDAALKRFLSGDPTILVATPGRLDDLLGEEEVRARFADLKTVVLDEADQMLDQGFAPAVKKILTRIPPKSTGWQGMCFSATMAKGVMDVAKCVLNPGFTTLSTVDPNEVPTHERVPQFLVNVPNLEDGFGALLALLQAEKAQSRDDFKAIVFGTTANGVGLLFDLFQNLMSEIPKFELHSRLTQTRRTKTTQEFKEASSGILFASDVVGRGMDFPNVGLVVQLGLPSSAEQYVHRVGRTARAGKDGRAVVILSRCETFFARINKQLPIQPYPIDLSSKIPAAEKAVQKAFTTVEEDSKARAYSAFLGYNKTFLKKLQLTPAELVRIANDWARAMGCPEPPSIPKNVVGKMGLKGVPGLNVGPGR